MASVLTRPTITDDDGSGTTGTIDDAAFWDSILDAIDALFSGAGAYTTFSFGGSVAASGAIYYNRGDTIGLSGRASSDTYYLGANYLDLNGSDNVITAARGSWRMSMRNATTLEWGLDWRAASAGAGTFTRMLTVGSNGQITLAGNGVVPAGSFWIWSGRSVIGSPADGSLSLTNNAGSTAVRLRFTTNARLEIRNSADSDFADIYGKAAVFTGSVTATGGFVGDLTGTASGNLTAETVGGDGPGTYTTITSITVTSDGLVSAISGS